MSLIGWVLRLVLKILKAVWGFMWSPQAFCLYIGLPIFAAGFYLFACIYTLVLVWFSVILPRP